MFLEIEHIYINETRRVRKKKLDNLNMFECFDVAGKFIDGKRL